MGWREAGDSRKLQEEGCTGLDDWQAEGNIGDKGSLSYSFPVQNNIVTYLEQILEPA